MQVMLLSLRSLINNFFGRDTDEIVYFRRCDTINLASLLRELRLKIKPGFLILSWNALFSMLRRFTEESDTRSSRQHVKLCRNTKVDVIMLQKNCERALSLEMKTGRISTWDNSYWVFREAELYNSDTIDICCSCRSEYHRIQYGQTSCSICQGETQFNNQSMHDVNIIIERLGQ